MSDWIRVQSALLTAVISAAIAIHFLLRYRRSKLHLQYAFFNLNLVAWYVADALWTSTGFTSMAISGARSAVAAAIPLTALRFFRTFAGDESRLARRVWRLFVGVTTVFVVLIVLHVEELHAAIQASLFAYIFLALYLTVYVLYERYRSIESRLEQARLKVLIASGAVAFTLALADYMPSFGYFFFGNIFTAVYLYFLFQVLVKLRVLDLFEFVGKSLVMATFAFVLAAIYIVLVVWWRDELNLFLFNTVIATVVLVMLFDPLRAFVETRMNQLIFSEKFAFAAQMDTLRRAMANIINVELLADMLIKRLESSRRVTHASMYLLEDDGVSYRLIAFVGPRPVARVDGLMHRPLLQKLTEGRVAIAEALEAERSALTDHTRVAAKPSVEVIDAQLETLSLLQSGISLPLVSEERLIGFLNLKDERLREAYSSEEIKILVQVAAQVAITIENSRLYEKIRERDRLAALGEMAAGLAHEIRNPLGAIKGAAQLLGDDREPGHASGDGEFVDIIVEEVNRLDSVVSQFLDYARPYKGNFVWASINDVVSRTAQLLGSHVAQHDVQIEPGRVPEVRTDPELLKQVFINLGINALQAMRHPGTLTIGTDVVEDRAPRVFGPVPARRQRVRVRFVDTGVGIAEDEISRIFMPFYTTKEKGTGLGLAICDRIVKNLGGSIEVQSRVGMGTTFSVLLPMDDEP